MPSCGRTMARSRDPRPRVLRLWPDTPTLSANGVPPPAHRAVRARRMLRVAIQALAWCLLPGGPSSVTVVGVLRVSIRLRRDQQHVLPVTGGVDIRRVAETGAAGLPVCRESESVSDSHEKAQGSGGTDPSPVSTGTTPATDVRPDATPSAFGVRSRAGRIRNHQDPVPDRRH